MSDVIFTPDVGTIGLPKDTKEGGQRVDFKVFGEDESAFDFLISTKCPRYAWARAIQCPCETRHTDETEQVGINCTNCNQLGWAFFLPHEYVVDAAVGELDDEQQGIVDRGNAVVIRALLTSASSQSDIFAVLGEYALGSATCTVRPKNKLGYYDRLIGIDEKMTFSEPLVADGTSVLKTRYPVVSVNAIMWLVDGVPTFATTDDFCLVAGVITWNTGDEPAEGARLTVHYLCHPVWIVQQIDRVSRTSLVKQKRGTTKTPQGDILDLPPRFVVRLSHLSLGKEQEA